MKRIFLDTSVIVSALLKPSGKSRQVFHHVLHREQLLVSFETLSEIEEVVSRPKFSPFFSESDRIGLLSVLIQSGEFIETQSAIDVCRDPSDNKFLNLAVDGKADFLISRDPDLLVLAPHFAVPIVDVSLIFQ